VTWRAHLFTSLGGLAAIAYVLWLVRRQGLRSKYALLWLSIAVVLMPFVVAPLTLNWIAARVGVYYPPTLLLLTAVALLFAVTVHFSWEMSRLEHKVRTLAEEVALLRLEQEQKATDHDA
jgi:hypothetical protein